MKNIVLIAAAGRGQRASKENSNDAPKQYLPLMGRAILQHTINLFAALPEIAGILVVIHPDDHALYAQSIANHPKLLPAAEGAATRQGSVLAGLRALQPHKPDFVLIHDAARPLVSKALVRRVLAEFADNPGVVPGLTIPDTLKHSEQGFAGKLVPRENITAIQTPQGFNFKEILKAHDAAFAAGEHGLTDDSEVAARAGMPVRIVDGDRDNIKITTPPDFEFARRLLENREAQKAMNVRTGTGFDVHKFCPGEYVTLCGVKIPHDHGLTGHSDADVGLHALVDALLGALGEADIGSHFPPSDPKWKGADSAMFLQHAKNLVSEKTGRINNVDVTLICEYPKIDPHRDAMCQRISEILAIPLARVSVKATTSEGLGFTGRREGIAAQAVATISLPDLAE